MLLLLRERARGRASRWARWLRLLPAAFDNLASWSDAELRPLHGCDCYWQAVAAREEVAALHRSVAARVGAAAAGTLAEWRWAYGAVATRAIALPAALGELDAGALVIVPVLDMANHAAAAQLELTVDAASGELRATTLAAVGAGTQLFLSYGSLDAEALLLSYGVPPAAAAPLAPVTLALAPPPALESADDLLAAVLLLLQHMGLPLDGWAGGDGAPLPARLLGTARLLSLRSADELTALPIAAADARPLSDANERAAVALVAAAIEAALAALAEPPAGGGGGGRRAAARLVWRGGARRSRPPWRRARARVRVGRKLGVSEIKLSSAKHALHKRPNAAARPPSAPRRSTRRRARAGRRGARRARHLAGVNLLVRTAHFQFGGVLLLAGQQLLQRIVRRRHRRLVHRPAVGRELLERAGERARRRVAREREEFEGLLVGGRLGERADEDGGQIVRVGAADGDVALAEDRAAARPAVEFQARRPHDAVRQAAVAKHLLRRRLLFEDAARVEADDRDVGGADQPRAF